MTIICYNHGIFEQIPSNHLSGAGCPTCSDKKKMNNETFIIKANIANNKLYDYSELEYINNKTKVKIHCVEHGSFYQWPQDHLKGVGCPRCSKSNYSKKSIQWLNSINPDIQHAENGGEYRIPNTRYHVDGYCKDTNTVYEFHGDKFHGNPKLFNDIDKCHPFDKMVTAGELYNKTIEREEFIKSLGYNLIVMWESDYIKSL